MEGKCIQINTKLREGESRAGRRTEGEREGERERERGRERKREREREREGGSRENEGTD